ncbi:MAG: flagellar basal body P-ring formation chaperone FlgA [Gammaproteobacteria bacterium]|nr:flagellar basal body P-ring formation chaperone FlgA [Gammaproteobacteria bacterium]
MKRFGIVESVVRPLRLVARPLRLIGPLTGLLAGLFTGPVQADLITEVSRFAAERAQLRYPNADISVNTRALDPRVQIPGCEDLTLELNGERRVGRVSVSVRCQQPQPWQLFVTTDINVTMPVVVSRRSILRNGILGREHVGLEPREIGRLRTDYLTDLEQVIGRQAKRAIQENAVIFSRQVVPAKLVKKGDKVIIRATRGAVTVATVGTALRDGIAGEQIPIRNRKSDRLINAWVIGRGLVSTSP